MPFPPPKTKIQIFDSEPPPNANTFAAGVPATSTQQDSLAIIMFSPNLQMIASLDNSNSAATSAYSVAVATGFTFSTTQSISITEEVGVNIEVVTEKTSITFALSFTEQWTTTTTNTMTFTCPPGQKSFVYQGTLMSKILQFNASNATYSWQGAAAKALTQILVTSNDPIGAAPSNSVTVS
jgi:hypothetical protein